MSGVRSATTPSQVDTPVDILPHDAVEHSRLELQHNILLRAFDNKVLHAPVEIKDDDCVLDIGTGTGIWLRDLVKEVPTKPQYLGVDIESNLFPPASTLAPNMRFEAQSGLDLPKEWTNKFILTHQRLLISSLRKHEWEQALNEIHRTLKPGGWVQLLEWQPWSSGPALAKHLDLFMKLSDDLGMMHRDLTLRLPDFLKESGFVDIHQDTRGTPLGSWANQDGVDGKKNLLSVGRWLKPSILRAGGYGIIQDATEYDELMEEISMEVDATPGSKVRWTMFWAQKPLE